MLKRDYEWQVVEAEPVRCGYVFGDHGEHECDSLAHEACQGSQVLVCHICRCGADVFVRGDR